MSVPYFARLLCLSLGAFFLMHLALAAVVSLFSRRAVRRAERMRPAAGARLLFALRLLPAATAGLLVAGLCAPAYLWLEPETSAERVGAACIAAALLGAATCAAGVVRGARASIRSSRYLRTCQAAAESDAPVLMLAGVFRSRLVVSRGVRKGLSPEQLAVALRHESAHGTSRDNLKRLLILLAPDTVPLRRGFGPLERGWRRLAEWAADDAAVAGDRRESLALASALVRVARMGAAAPASEIATPLLGDPDDLSPRVERLLHPGAAADDARWAWAPIALGVCIAAIAMQPSTLPTVHRLLEKLAH